MYAILVGFYFFNIIRVVIINYYLTIKCACNVFFILYSNSKRSLIRFTGHRVAFDVTSSIVVSFENNARPLLIYIIIYEKTEIRQISINRI